MKMRLWGWLGRAGRGAGSERRKKKNLVGGGEEFARTHTCTLMKLQTTRGSDE